LTALSLAFRRLVLSRSVISRRRVWWLSTALRKNRLFQTDALAKYSRTNLTMLSGPLVGPWHRLRTATPLLPISRADANIWCLPFVLIRQGLRGGSGPQRLIRALGEETGNPIMAFHRPSFFPSLERALHHTTTENPLLGGDPSP